MRRKGFTLIELLVAVSIGMILTVGGLAAYRGFGERQSLIQAGLKLESNLRLAQKKSFSGEKPAIEKCSESERLNGFLLKSENNISYEIDVDCSGETERMGEVISLPEEIIFSTESFDIFFPVLKSAVIPITIILQSDSFSYQVTVEESGVVRGELL